MIDYLCNQIKKYNGIKFDNHRLLSTKEIHNLVDIDFSHLDQKNIIIDDRYVLLSDGGSRHSDLLRLKKLCVLCVYDIREKYFEVIEVTKQMDFINHLIIPIDPLIQHVKFENEIHGASAFIYFSTIKHLSIRVKYQTYRAFPRHLRHDINCKRIWIKENIWVF